jgi:hypothetical protein
VLDQPEGQAVILAADYFGEHKGYAPEHLANAMKLLGLVNELLAACPFELPVNPHTDCLVSGQRFGGWRPPSCVIGAPNSAHKTGEAVDVHDPGDRLDAWLTDELLKKHDLYREHPDATHGWCHLTTRAPRSGRRTFKP